MDILNDPAVKELRKRIKDDRYLYRGYMPARHFGPYDDQMAWNGAEWVEIKDPISWMENTESISEEKYLKVLAEMGGKDLS
jgi:hypothetical protein